MVASVHRMHESSFRIITDDRQGGFGTFLENDNKLTIFLK